MDTATKAPQGVRPADKVLQALATLAALIDSTIREVKSLDGEFQSRLLQAVHDTEASLQSQTAAHVERARQEVQEELNGKFQNDLQAALDRLKSEFEGEREKDRENLRKAVHETEVLLKAETAEHVEHARLEVQEQLTAKYQQELQSSLDALKSEFEVERERDRENLRKAGHETEVLLKAETAEHVEQARLEVQEQLTAKHQQELQASLDALKSEFEVEREKDRESLRKTALETEALLKAETAERVEHARLEVQEQLTAKHQQELQAGLNILKSEFEVERTQLNEVASMLESEKSGLIAQMEKLKADSAIEIEKAREEAKAAAAKQPAAPAPSAASVPSAPSASLQQEIERAETKLQEILKIIDNPATELSTVIRKNVEKSELEAYLKGIRLVLNAKS